MRGTLTPFDFKAINSLSAEMRPKTRRRAVRKSPRDREGEGKRQHQGHERQDRRNWNIRVVDQDVEQLAEKIAEDENKAEDNDSKEGRRNHAHANIPIDNLHQKTTRLPCASDVSRPEGAMDLGDGDRVFKPFYQETKRLAVDFAALNKVVVAQPGFNLQGKVHRPPWHDHTMVIPQGRFYLGDQSLVSGEKNVIHHLLLGLFISDRRRWVGQKLRQLPGDRCSGRSR